jgi:methylmalonyl-CoA mutase
MTFQEERRGFGSFWWCNLPSEIAELQAYWNHQIYAPDDGRAMGLQGMINDLVQQSDSTGDNSTNELDQLELKKINISPESYQQLT